MQQQRQLCLLDELDAANTELMCGHIQWQAAQAEVDQFRHTAQAAAREACEQRSRCSEAQEQLNSTQVCRRRTVQPEQRVSCS